MMVIVDIKFTSVVIVYESRGDWGKCDTVTPEQYLEAVVIVCRVLFIPIKVV